jgi:hypothetical protein
MSDNAKLQQYINELSAQTNDPIHIRLISAYIGANPKESIEEELGKILIEIIENED